MKSVYALAAVGVAVALALSNMAGAKSPTPLPPTERKPVTSATNEPSMASKVENWTKAEWNAAKAEWAKDQAKWAKCRKRADVNKLSGRKSWPFLYDCMRS